MPIVHSDRISGAIYVIARNAEHAGDRAIEYLRVKNEGQEHQTYGVFDEYRDAERALHNRYDSYDSTQERVYKVSLDIRTADGEA